jgi:MFS family permease
LNNSRPAAGGKPGWRLPTGWKNGAGPAYTPIPARRSSKNQAGRNKTPLSTEIKISPKTSVAPLESAARRGVRGSHALRSISSRGSLEMAVGRDEVPLRDWDRKTSLLEQIGDIIADPVDKIGCANTVHWLKELLSTSEPYEPQFTPLPLRMRKDVRKTALNTILKSGKNSDRVEVDILKGRPVAPVVAKPKTNTAKRDKRTDASEAFTQTINDLELLMNEALIIARQAADTPDAPCVLGNAARMLKSGRERSEEEMRARCQSRIRRDVASIHESLRSLSDSESYMTEESESCPLRPPTPLPGVTRAITINSKSTLAKNPSGWPPTGRSSTPYPPNSQLPSNQSPARNSNESVDQIKSADPRSMPLETRIGDRRKRTASMPPEGQSITTSLGPLFHSKRGSDFNDSLAYSDFDMSEPPQFRTLEFNRGRSITLKTMSSGKSPLRLDPVKTDPVRFDNISRDPGKIPLNINGQPGTGGYTGPLPYFTPPDMSAKRCAKGHTDDDRQAVTAKLKSKSVPGKREVRDYIVEHFHPPITERESSLNLRQKVRSGQEKPRALSGVTGKTGMTYNWQNIDQSKIEPCPISAIRASTVCEENQQPGYAQSYDGSNISHEMDFNTGYAVRQRGGGGEPIKNQTGYELHDNPDPNLALTNRYGPRKSHPFNLRGMNHVSLKDHHLKGFSLARSHKKQKIARDWSPARKRFVAFVSCLSTALIGLLVGIYAGETPSIQYYIVDLHHYTVLGNVFFFIGLSIPTFFFWPLPLLHGRKPYILGSMSLAMPLLFPQALAVGQVRSPYVATWRVALILPRAAMGFCLGFANMNFKSMLTDVFGASLQSSNPHQEHADEYDVRRHGGGMGIWLGLWTWSALGSIGVGFMIGAFIINHHNPAWGFYISIVIIAFVMLLNVVVPETRRAAYRRSVAEVANADGKVSRRLGRGEVKMHMVHTGPKWWGEEFHYGVTLTVKMLRQPGFMVMAFYVAWIYGQMVLTILVRTCLSWYAHKLT